MPVARRVTATLIGALLAASLLAATPAHADSTVYKWVDEYGTLHLSTSKPPAGVKYQTLKLPTSSGSSARPAGGSGAGAAKAPGVSPAQAAQRANVLNSLKNRECVIALEALDRLTTGAQPTSAEEINRLKQTADLNCSKDPTRRREQEDMAAKLRVANGPDCVAARSKLADLLGPGSNASPEQKRAQQAFVDEHCIPPVQ
jgi:hypothetical protein